MADFFQKIQTDIECHRILQIPHNLLMRVLVVHVAQHHRFIGFDKLVETTNHLILYDNADNVRIYHVIDSGIVGFDQVLNDEFG